MAAPYSGSCNCGAIKATIDVEPMWVRQCWCIQCQKAAAGSATNNALFATKALDIAGDVAWRGYTAASGNSIEHGFCPSCGTPIFSRNSSRQGAWVVRLGFLDGDHGLKPGAAIWLDEAPEWALIDPSLEQFAGQPPLPPRT